MSKKDITQANVLSEMPLVSEKHYDNPFIDVMIDLEVTDPNGDKKRVPAFWAGGKTWRVRYASPEVGTHNFKTICSRADDTGLHGVAGEIEVTPYTGDNVLYTHGPIGISEDKRHFEYRDGTPFLWLADTWWKALSKRLSWEDFQELCADRREKGFNAVQLVCGPYPDENMMEARWENEGGMPYATIDFSVVNPAYFDYADKRIAHVADSGLVPVIVGGWGRPQQGGESTLQQVGLEGFKRHWRHLVARYGAYAPIWVVGGETKDSYGPWSEVAQYLRDIDPFGHTMCYHSPGHPREALSDNSMFDFDMVAIGHNGFATAAQTLTAMKSCLAATPERPVLCGECAYEGHMQTNFQDVQRHMFWTFMLSGAAGHTYGVAGVWQASIEGDPGIDPVYDLTTWREGMNYPGSTQVGLAKELLEHYPWERFEAHPEWTEEDCFAAGIPGEVRFIYQPKRNIYDWSGTVVKALEPGVSYSAFYFDPATGKRYDQRSVAGPEDYQVPKLPSPQDWVLVLEKMGMSRTEVTE